jgi:hypothetical protein
MHTDIFCINMHTFMLYFTGITLELNVDILDYLNKRTRV